MRSRATEEAQLYLLRPALNMPSLSLSSSNCHQNNIILLSHFLQNTLDLENVLFCLFFMYLSNLKSILCIRCQRWYGMGDQEYSQIIIVYFSDVINT